MYEPYGVLFKDVLNAGKNGKVSDVRQWLNIFTRIEKIFFIINKRGSTFARIVINENIAHRYADYYCQVKKYEQKMIKCYKLSYTLALTTKYVKYIDSSLYWLAEAYRRNVKSCTILLYGS